MEHLKVDVAVIKLTGEGYCTYCHRRFGDLVYWRHRQRFLQETVDHVIPRAIGGRITVPCCSICNSIKGSLIFDSLVEIQDYCLDRLLAEKSFTVESARKIRINRAIRTEEVTQEEIEIEFGGSEKGGEVTSVVLEHSDNCRGCNQCDPLYTFRKPTKVSKCTKPVASMKWVIKRHQRHQEAVRNGKDRARRQSLRPPEVLSLRRNSVLKGRLNPIPPLFCTVCGEVRMAFTVKGEKDHSCSK